MTGPAICRPTVAALLIGGAMLCVPGVAMAQAVQSSLDVQAGLGYSSNPLLVTGSSDGSAFGRLSGSGLLAWKTERSATTLSAYVESSTYFTRYSSKQLFNFAAHSERAVTQKVRLFGDLGVSGDFGGMLSSRFFAVPSSPVVVDPTIPQSFVGVDPDVYGVTGRQYRVSGQVGAAITVSPRDSMNVSVGAQRLFVGKNSTGLDYNQYDSSLGYEHQLDERLTVGGRVVAQYSDYSNGRSVTSFGPQATVRARISQQWDATAAIGFLRTHQDLGSGLASDSSVDLALDGSLCRNLESERMCARVARRSQSTIIGGSSTTTSAGIDYYRRLTQRDTVQFNASAVRSGGLRFPFTDQKSTFLTTSASYNHMLTTRLSSGLELSARRLARVGPDPRSDFAGSGFVRYRLGDVQ